MAAAEAHGRAYARVALAGNPSDGYGGATLALTIGNFFAEVTAAEHPALAVEPESTLVRAAALRLGSAGALLRWTTTIPREVGLGGSSALVIATARALGALHGVELSPPQLAAFALAVEVEDLGIAAGPQDRVVQAHEGLVLMDFHGPEPAVERVDSELLPPLLLVHTHAASGPSGDVHRDLRARVARGDAMTLAAIDELARHARDARAALAAGDHEAFGRCLDGSFDARRRLIPLDPRQAKLIEIARAGGAAANYAGSGGAVVCACRDVDHRRALAEALEREGCLAERPLI